MLAAAVLTLTEDRLKQGVLFFESVDECLHGGVPGK